MLLEGRSVDVDDVLNGLGLEPGNMSGEDIITRCPWPENHKKGDTNPSFAINFRTGAWICFRGCGSGALIQLVQRLQNNDFDDARLWMLTKAGKEISYQAILDVLPREPIDDSSVAEVMAVVKTDYESSDPTTTSAYFLERGFTPKLIKEWGIRYDRHARAIVIPVQDISGENMMGLIRRMVPPVPVGMPKYRFTTGFDKSSHLFGAHRHPRDGRHTILVEGPLDALWLHQHGYTSAVSLMGAYCSDEQLRLLSSLSHGIVLSLDNDEAGRAATDRLIALLSKKFSVQLTLEYGGKDVQELDAYKLAEVFGNLRYIWQK